MQFPPLACRVAPAIQTGALGMVVVVMLVHVIAGPVLNFKPYQHILC